MERELIALHLHHSRMSVILELRKYICIRDKGPSIAISKSVEMKKSKGSAQWVHVM